MPVTRPPVARMQYIYEKIRTERRPNCSTLAKALEVSAKTVQRDIDFMRYQMEGAHVEPVQLRFTGWAARVAPERVWHSSQKSRHSKRDESLEMVLG